LGQTGQDTFFYHSKIIILFLKTKKKMLSLWLGALLSFQEKLQNKVTTYP
jgi:hypothetical protein